jgi:hypothetical protein
VDIDGVISLFGFPSPAPPAWRSGDPASSPAPPEGAFHTIDGIPHFLSTAAALHLRELVSVFELVWCSGWEEKADEYLPHLLGLPRGLPFLSFEREMHAMSGADGGDAVGTRAHWKLNAIDAYAGDDRPLAWIDDAFDDSCHAWAVARAGSTLLVQTEPPTGLTEREAVLLREWALAAAPE